MSKTSEKSFLLIFLGTLSAFGPFVMDMYLPTLPAMSDFFHTSSPMVQLGLTAGMTGLAAGQLIFGPLSDRYGRRRPLIAAMILFLVSTLGCILSREIIPFIALRFIQGVAGAGGVVLSRSIAADKYSSHELAAMLALIGAVNGIATVAAPIAGGILAGSGGWHSIPVSFGNGLAGRQPPSSRVSAEGKPASRTQRRSRRRLQGRIPQPAIHLLCTAIRIYHERAVRQHIVSPLHHAGAFRTFPLFVQRLLRNQRHRHDNLFHFGGKASLDGTSTTDWKPRDAALFGHACRCPAIRMQLLDL